MNGCLETPSPILLQYATLGVNPAPKRRAGVYHKVHHRPWPCRVISRFAQRCKAVTIKPEPVEDEKPSLDELNRLFSARPRYYNWGCHIGCEVACGGSSGGAAARARRVGPAPAAAAPASPSPGLR